ncbi:hypothetical protein [Nocardia sienata]|uniref:hypothetical protein n=1 Tax=Nocardia sienata TaxID=248552 RepID=UPI0007A3BC23|nr:hypothetical protein [Nocardia sienata]
MSRVPYEYVAFANRLSVYVQTYVQKVRIELDGLIRTGTGVGPGRLVAEDAAGAERIPRGGPVGTEGRAGAEAAAGHGAATPRADNEHTTPARPDRRRVAEIVRDAGADSGNFGVGRAGRAEADAAGLAWVGLEARPFPYGGTQGWVSADGLRQYRPPQRKSIERGVQANYESRSDTRRHWESNAHLEIEERS